MDVITPESVKNINCFTSHKRASGGVVVVVVVIFEGVGRSYYYQPYPNAQAKPK